MARIVCTDCFDENGTVFVEAGGLVMENGSLTLLQTFSEAPDVHLPFAETGLSFDADGECGWCGHHAPIREFLEPRPTVASH